MKKLIIILLVIGLFVGIFMNREKILFPRKMIDGVMCKKYGWSYSPMSRICECGNYTLADKYCTECGNKLLDYYHVRECSVCHRSNIFLNGDDKICKDCGKTLIWAEELK